jgi:hypothetical protein
MAEKKIAEFFSIGLEENVKLFRRWVSMDNIGLAFLGAFSETLTGRLVAQRLFGLPLCANPQKKHYDEVRREWTYHAGRPTGEFKDSSNPWLTGGVSNIVFIIQTPPMTKIFQFSIWKTTSA